MKFRSTVLMFFLAFGAGDVPAPCLGQEKAAAPQPVIDVHWHAPGKTDLPAALAEELDVPVGIHLGFGPPGAAYLSRSGFPPVKSPNYRGAVGDPLLLEDVLLKHPKLRVYVMHAAYPFRDSMVYRHFYRWLKPTAI